MQFRTEEDFVMSLLRLCGKDWAVMDASKGHFHSAFSVIYSVVWTCLDVSEDAGLVSGLVLSSNCISTAYVT